MLPTNNNSKKGCTPQSSSCVIWNGPDLPCIDLCKGDSIDEVLFQIATELCEVLDLLDLDTYDDVPESIDDMRGLIQTIINVLQQELPEIPEGGAETCMCPVTLADCFQYQNEFGDTITELPLIDYARLIAERVCELVDQANGNTLAIQQLNQDVDNLQNQIDAIIINNGEVQYYSNITQTTGPLSQGVRSIEDLLLDLMGATGSASDLYQAILAAGPNLNTSDRCDGLGTMATIPGWNTTPTSLADSFSNMWLAILDLKSTCGDCCDGAGSACSGIALNFRAIIDPGNTTVTIFLDGSVIPSGFQDCTPLGSPVLIQDAMNNNTTTNVNIISTASNPSGVSIDLTGTPIDLTSDLTVTLSSCLFNPTSSTTCEKEYTDYVYPDLLCPDVVVVPEENGGQITLSNLVIGNTYIVNIYNQGGAIAIQTSNFTAINTSEVLTVGGLATGTTYDVEVQVVRSAGDNKICPKTQFTTGFVACIQPIVSGANVVILP